MPSQLTLSLSRVVGSNAAVLGNVARLCDCIRDADRAAVDWLDAAQINVARARWLWQVRGRRRRIGELARHHSRSVAWWRLRWWSMLLGGGCLWSAGWLRLGCK